MWIWMAFASALLLGVYDAAKKHALRKNDVLFILLAATSLSALFVSPFLSAGVPLWHMQLGIKALLVGTSWISGMIALKHLPLTTVVTFKTSRPVFIVLGSILIFGEKLSPWQLAAMVLVLVALWLLSRSSEKEGYSFRSNKGFWAMVVSVLTGVASALLDKYIMVKMEPLFVQSWTNVYISVFLLLVLLVKKARGGVQPFRWDWTIVLIAVLITGADMLYFFSLKADGAMLSVVTLIRRSISVIVTFALGAVFFKEKRIVAKAGILAIMLIGVGLLMFASA